MCGFWGEGILAEATYERKVRRAGWLIPAKMLEGMIGNEAKEVRGDRSFRMRPPTGLPATKIELLHPRPSPDS